MNSGYDGTAAPVAFGPSAVEHDGGVSAVHIHVLFVDTLGVRVPDDDTDVIASGLLDSLGVAELLLTLEERFGITIDMATLDLDDVRSVRSIVGLVTGLRERRAE